MGVFINISNHFSESWSEQQINAARLYGEIIDLPFPDVDPLWTDEETEKIVNEYFNTVASYDNPTAMVQGEFVFSYRLVSRLKDANIRTVAACGKRISTETTDESKNTIKCSMFVFEKFKEY